MSVIRIAVAVMGNEEGKVLLVHRGKCTFVSKVLHGEAVGIGMCMYNSKIQYSLLNLRCNSSLMLGVQWCFHSQLVRLEVRSKIREEAEI